MVEGIAATEIAKLVIDLGVTATLLILFVMHFLRKDKDSDCLLYTSPSPRDRTRSRMPSSA